MPLAQLHARAMHALACETVLWVKSWCAVLGCSGYNISEEQLNMSADAFAEKVRAFAVAVAVWALPVSCHHVTVGVVPACVAGCCSLDLALWKSW